MEKGLAGSLVASQITENLVEIGRRNVRDEVFIAAPGDHGSWPVLVRVFTQGHVRLATPWYKRHGGIFSQLELAC